MQLADSPICAETVQPIDESSTSVDKKAPLREGGPALVINYDNTATYFGVEFKLQPHQIDLIRVLHADQTGVAITSGDLQKKLKGTGAKKKPNIAQVISRIRRELKKAANELPKGKQRTNAINMIASIFPRGRGNQGYCIGRKGLVEFKNEQ